MYECDTTVKVISGKHEGAIATVIGAWRTGKKQDKVSYTLFNRELDIFIDNIGEEEVIAVDISDDSGGTEE